MKTWNSKPANYIKLKQDCIAQNAKSYKSHSFGLIWKIEVVNWQTTIQLRNKCSDLYIYIDTGPVPLDIIDQSGTKWRINILHYYLQNYVHIMRVRWWKLAESLYIMNNMKSLNS